MTAFVPASPLDDLLPDELAAMRGDAAPEPASAAAPETDDDTPAAEDKPADAAAPADETPAPAVEVAAEPEAPEEARQPLPAKPAEFTIEQKDYDTERKALRDEKKALLSKWSDGEMTDEAYAAAVDAADEKLSALVAEQTRAATLRDINEQNARAVAEAAAKAENAAMQAVAIASKKAGQIDYGTDTVACQQFDALFTAAKLDPANAKLTIHEVTQKAHDAVLAIRGIAKAPAAAAPAPEAKPKPVIPQTLAHLQSAAAPQIGNDLSGELLSIEDPDLAEARWARLSQAQRDNELRGTLPVSRARRIQ
jgi:hypothetical protein